MNKFKIRASQCGKIMGKTGINKTGETYCQNWLKEQIYKTEHTFTSKYCDKGNICEDESIDFIAEQLGYGFLMKNEEFKQNEYVTGTADIVLPDTIIDAKNSWDCFTFPLFEDKIPNNDYYYQLQCYMWLYDKPQAKLCYVLSNTPLGLIESEAYKWCKSKGYDELDSDILQKFIHKMTYNEIEPKYKIKTFDVLRDEETIKLITERVNECRVYIETLLK